MHNITIETPYYIDRQVYVLYKGKVRKAVITQVNSRTKVGENDFIENSIISITFRVLQTGNLPQELHQLDLSSKPIEHWVYFNLEEVSKQVFSEIDIQKEAEVV
jgi:hypothetical protein